MSTPRAEQVFKEIIQHYEPYEGCSKSDVLTTMEEYGRQMWNAALDWAADKVETTFDSANNVVVDRNLILNAKRY